MSDTTYLRNPCPVCGAPMLGMHYHESEGHTFAPESVSVGGSPWETGCYVDGHLGQYAPRRAVILADDVTGGSIGADWPTDDDGEELGAYGTTGPWGGLMGDDVIEDIYQRSDDAESALNAVTVGGYWEWWEGEFFLRAYCATCGESEEEHPEP